MSERVEDENAAAGRVDYGIVSDLEIISEGIVVDVMMETVRYLGGVYFIE